MFFLRGDDKHGLFMAGVFDGHGGVKASMHAAERIGMVVDENWEKMGIGNALLYAFGKADDEICAWGEEGRCGSTATVVVLKGGEMWIAHVGDTRAVMGMFGGGFVRLCEDHRPGRTEECERIEATGGLVVNVAGVPRVNGVLAVSRALGDADLKEVVIGTPDVRKVVLGGGEMFVVVATDGLWDVVGDEECVKVVRECWGDVQVCVKRLVDLACEKGSKDDVCVLCVDVAKVVGVVEMVTPVADEVTETPRAGGRMGW